MFVEKELDLIWGWAHFNHDLKGCGPAGTCPYHRGPIMRDLVQEILQAEKRAEELLQHAREEAAGITAQADTEAKKKVADARAKAQEIIGQTVQQLRREAEEIRKRTIEEAEHKSRALANRSDVPLDDLADQVARMIIKTDLE